MKITLENLTEEQHRGIMAALTPAVQVGPRCESCNKPLDLDDCHTDSEGIHVCHDCLKPEPTPAETPNAKALRELDLKPGDVVLVDGSGRDHGLWVKPMDAAIGKECEVMWINKDSAPDNRGARLGGSGGGYYFPAHCLTLVRRAGEAKTITREQAYDELAEGDKVRHEGMAEGEWYQLDGLGDIAIYSATGRRYGYTRKTFLTATDWQIVEPQNGGAA